LKNPTGSELTNLDLTSDGNNSVNIWPNWIVLELKLKL
jgi:hypothetical protein